MTLTRVAMLALAATRGPGSFKRGWAAFLHVGGDGLLGDARDPGRGTKLWQRHVTLAANLYGLANSELESSRHSRNNACAAEQISGATSG